MPHLSQPRPRSRRLPTLSPTRRCRTSKWARNKIVSSDRVALKRCFHKTTMTSSTSLRWIGLTMKHSLSRIHPSSAKISTIRYKSWASSLRTISSFPMPTRSTRVYRTVSLRYRKFNPIRITRQWTSKSISSSRFSNNSTSSTRVSNNANSSTTRSSLWKEKSLTAIAAITCSCPIGRTWKEQRTRAHKSTRSWSNSKRKPSCCSAWEKKDRIS